MSTNLPSVLNKLCSNDPENTTRWKSIVNQQGDEKQAVKFMIDLCLRRRGWIPIFCECLASTPHLFQNSSTSSALDPPVVQLVLKELLDYNQIETYSEQEKSAREVCIIEFVQLLLIGLTAPDDCGVIRSVFSMDSLSLIQHIILPCLRPGHPNLHTGLLLTQLALSHWNKYESVSVVAIMLKKSLAELASHDSQALAMLMKKKRQEKNIKVINEEQEPEKETITRSIDRQCEKKEKDGN